MVDELQRNLEAYLESWADLTARTNNPEYFSSLKPTALGWKFEDRAAALAAADALRDACDQIHYGWVNERWLITLHLKDTTLPGGIRLIKYMERRPGSTDKVGLDHVDFYSSEPVLEHVKNEPGLTWNEEVNGEHCKWISVWFDAGEAKLRTDTVLKVCADELRDYENNIVNAA